MKTDDLLKLAMDITTYCVNSDPYGALDEMCDDETEAEYIQRTAADIASVDGIKGALSSLYFWGWSEDREAKKVLDGFNNRLEVLEKAVKTA